MNLLIGSTAIIHDVVNWVSYLCMRPVVVKSSLDGWFRSLTAMAAAKGSSDGINGHVFVTKARHQVGGEQLWFHPESDGLDQVYSPKTHYAWTTISPTFKTQICALNWSSAQMPSHPMTTLGDVTDDDDNVRNRERWFLQSKQNINREENLFRNKQKTVELICRINSSICEGWTIHLQIKKKLGIILHEYW